MLHLAQIQKNQFSGKLQLRLLAYQQSEYFWELITSESAIASTDIDLSSEGMLVLVEISNNQEVVNIQDAKDWVLNLITQYLTIGVSPEFLTQEAKKAEQWRQILTLQSQELARKTLEIEARREQIQSVISIL